MPFQLSPGVNVSEIDLTTIVPAVSSTTGAIAGVFRWGPVEEVHLISTEDELANLYGKPNSNNPETFFTAGNFLSYGNQLYVSRAASLDANNAWGGNYIPSTNSTYDEPGKVIKNLNDFEMQYSMQNDADVDFIAKYPGLLGNSLKISVCASPSQYQSAVTVSRAPIANTSYDDTVWIANTQSTYAISVGSNTAYVSVV